MNLEFQEDIVDVLLRYGLFLGAIFQLICIGAVIVMPDPKSDALNESDVSEEDQSDRDSPQVSPNHKQYRNMSKKEKKKRR